MMYVTIGMLGSVALDQWAYLFKFHLANVHVCSTFSQQAAQASLPQGQQTYLLLRITGPAHMSETKQLCMSIKAKRDLQLQYPCFQHYVEPTCMFVAVAPDNLACRLQLNSTCMHVC